MIRMISCSITPARRRRQQDALHHPQRMSKAAEPPWATLLPATSDTPAVALYHDSEYVRSMVEIPCALEYRALHVLIWITRLPLRPTEALVRVESCDAFEVHIGNVRIPPYSEVLLSTNDTIWLRCLSPPEVPKQAAFCRAAGKALSIDDAPPVVLGWRFKHNEYTALALVTLREANPWLDDFARSAATEYELYAQPVLLRVSEATLREASLARHGPARVEPDPQAPLPDDTATERSAPPPVLQHVCCPVCATVFASFARLSHHMDSQHPRG